MIRNFLWFIIGGAAVVFVIWKGREFMKRRTPAAVAQRVDQTRQSVSARVSEFIDTAREASAEREAELRDALGMNDDGVVTQP